MALELVSGADFWCKLMSGGCPVPSKGVPGLISGLKPRKNGPKILIFTPFLPPLFGTGTRAPRVCSQDPRCLLKDPGVLLKDPGVLLKAPGASFFVQGDERGGPLRSRGIPGGTGSAENPVETGPKIPSQDPGGPFKGPRGSFLRTPGVL